MPKLIHTSLPPVSDPDLLETLLEVVKVVREKRVRGLAITYLVEEDVEYVRHITDECEPEALLDGIVALGQEILEDYNVEDYRPGRFFE